MAEHREQDDGANDPHQLIGPAHWSSRNDGFAGHPSAFKVAERRCMISVLLTEDHASKRLGRH
jgi:hypothetical protein